MIGLVPNFGSEGKTIAPIGSCLTKTTFEGKLKEEKERLEKKLADVNSVLEALAKAPQVKEVLEALNKLGY